MFEIGNICEEFGMISLEEKIGSMLIIGFEGDINDDSNRDYLDAIESGYIGGSILFSRNIESETQLKDLTFSIHKSNPNCLIFVDQEGGVVQRLKFNSYPTAKFIRENYSIEEAKEVYSSMASELKDYNIDVNFGPTVDLDHDTHACPVIGGLDRSYSTDPRIVTDYANAFIDAHHASNIITAIKHFPGHGYASGDTHAGLVDVTETFRDVELEPFYNLIERNKVDIIMTAHIINRNLDTNYPATMSKITLDKLLKSKGYDGIIVSDDLHMGAILADYSFEESIIKSLAAGCDILIFSNNPLACENIKDFKPDPGIATKIIDIVKQAITDGHLTESQIDKSYLRIQKLKNKFKS